MNRLHLFSLLLLALGLGVLSFEGAIAQDKKDKTDKKAKQPQLPPNFGKLGLSDEQKQKILKIDADYDAKIAELDAKIKELKAESKKKMYEVLTEEQKKKYLELVTPGAPPTPPEKKSDK
ncbi:MAG: hypothetical protein N2112_14115 [Gemmataceae bacterium]|jgi:Spy/CpxP family protein refolding chaperone|nr:hypothetical protein [Gemmataceae bacterium]